MDQEQAGGSLSTYLDGLPPGLDIPATMKAVAVFPREKRLGLTDLDAPELKQQDEVLVRTLEVGVCGTDREIARFDYGDPPEGSEFLVLGHEGLGEVVRTDPGVQTLKAGDLVVPTVRRPCGQPICPACAVGRQDFCYTGLFTERGIQKRHGFMTEQFVERERYLHKLPAGLKDIGVLVEPLTIACKARRQIFEVQDRLPWACTAGGGHGSRTEQNIFCRRALVLGAGPVGLLGAMTLALAGFETIVYSRVSGLEQRLALTQAIGCKFIKAEEVPSQDLMDHTGHVDVVYEAMGASQLAFEVLHVLGPNAIFIFTGVPGRKTTVQVNTDEIMRDLVLKNQVLIGTVNAAAEDFEAAINHLAEFEKRWPGVTRQLKTGQHPPEAAPELIQHGRGIKEVVKFG